MRTSKFSKMSPPVHIKFFKRVQPPGLKVPRLLIAEDQRGINGGKNHSVHILLLTLPL